MKHIEDTGIFDVKRLRPILQSSGQLAGGAPETFQKKRAERGVWRSGFA